MNSIDVSDIAVWFALAAAGFFVSTIFESAKKRVLAFFANKTRSTAFDGTWYCYHATRKDKEKTVVLESCWDVSKSISSDFIIKTYRPSENVSQSSYFGEREQGRTLVGCNSVQIRRRKLHKYFPHKISFPWK